MNDRKIFNTHEIKGLEVKIFYPSNEEYQIIIEKLLLPNQKFEDMSMYFDLGQYEICEFLIPMITNLDISPNEAKKELKRMIMTTDDIIQPLIIDFQDILNIVTGIFAQNVNNSIGIE